MYNQLMVRKIKTTLLLLVMIIAQMLFTVPAPDASALACDVVLGGFEDTIEVDTVADCNGLGGVVRSTGGTATLKCTILAGGFTSVVDVESVAECTSFGGIIQSNNTGGQTSSNTGITCSIVNPLDPSTRIEVTLNTEQECVSANGFVVGGSTNTNNTGGSSGSRGGNSSNQQPTSNLSDERLDVDNAPPEGWSVETTKDLDVKNLNVKCSNPENPSEDDNSIMCTFIRVVNVLSIGVAIVASITVAVTGYQYSASRGSPEATSRAVARLAQVGLAIVVYIFGWTMLNWLVPGGVLN